MERAIELRADNRAGMCELDKSGPIVEVLLADSSLVTVFELYHCLDDV